MSRAIGIVALSLSLVLIGTAPGAAQGKANALKIQPAEFDPERICDAKPDWVRGIGLFAPDDRFAAAFLMQKTCSTATNAAGFGLVSGVKGETLIGPAALGFDYKNFNAGFAAHCGAGAPRFQVAMSDGSFSFLGGCANATKFPDLPATGWTRVRIDPQDPAQAFPTVPTNATIVDIALVFDEGPDNDPNGSPQIVLDNIFINGKFATRP
jgi:hypothetical protein